MPEFKIIFDYIKKIANVLINTLIKFWLFIVIIFMLIIYCMLNNKRPIKYYVKPTNLDSKFIETVNNILNVSGWNMNYNLIETKQIDDATVTIELIESNKMQIINTNAEYYPNGKRINFSLTGQSIVEKPIILIDATNWLYGVAESGLSLENYRTYVINHEMGHALGYDHVKCNGMDKPNNITDSSTSTTSNPCPIMYQSTRGCPGGTCGYNVYNSDLNGPKLLNRYISD